MKDATTCEEFEDVVDHDPIDDLPEKRVPIQRKYGTEGNITDFNGKGVQRKRHEIEEGSFGGDEDDVPKRKKKMANVSAVIRSLPKPVLPIPPTLEENLETQTSQTTDEYNADESKYIK